MSRRAGSGTRQIEMKPLRIAMLGTRGVPASYSGFETCVEELGRRLVARGHSVTVYCRKHHISYPGSHYHGMRLVKLPTIRNKYFDTIAHALLSSVHALGQRFDVCLYFIAGNSLVTWIPRLAGQRTIINVDGLDWKREKWPPLAKRYIRLAEKMATVLPSAMLTDSRVIQRYYEETYGVRPAYIAYGADVEPLPPGETLRRLGLEPRRYVLFVGRLVPENCAHHLVEAFCGLDERAGMKCVIVGDAPYAEEYISSLKDKACADVVFTGYLFGDGYRELSSSAYLFVETSGVGGTHPALLEAMGFGNCVVANDTPENLETIGPAGFPYAGREAPESLRTILRELLASPDVVHERRALSLAHVRSNYSWDAVTDRYEDLFRRVMLGARPGTRPLASRRWRIHRS